MIEFKNVNKVLHKKRETIQTLRDISFEIGRHDIFGVIGCSGTGKSTLAWLVNQLKTVSDNQVIVDGYEIDTYRERDLHDIKRDTGMTFQHFNLLNSKSVYKNVAMPLILSKTNKKEIKEKTDEVLESVGLTDKKDQFPDGLSGGQKQRVAIARTLVTHPKILLCDEATSTLDPVTTSSALNLLNNMNRTFGATIMMTTHEMNVIQKTCHRIAVMENGKVIEVGTVKDVLSHSRMNTIKNFASMVVNIEPSKELQASFDSGRDLNFTDYRLSLDSEQIRLPILNEPINGHHLNVNVLFSSMSEIQDETVCYLWLRFEYNESFNDLKLTDYLSKQHIRYEEAM